MESRTTSDPRPSGPRGDPVFYAEFTPDQRIVHDIADTIYRPPVKLTDEYRLTCERTAAYLRNPSWITSVTISFPISLPPQTTTPWGSLLFPLIGSSGGNADDVLRNSAFAARNNVFAILDRVSSFITRAASAGFAPPDNPFIVIAQLNSSRANDLLQGPDARLANDLVANVQAYLQLMEAEASGKLNLEKQVNRAAQLSSINLSFDGFGGSGDPSRDLLRFLPDMDAVKDERAREVLAVLDFSKRVPRVLFTADYAPDGQSKGAIVGWRRIPDASGYVITRRNIFTGRTITYQLSNEQLKGRYAQVQDYVNAWVLTFYDDVSPQSIWAFLDSAAESDAYYLYVIQAYQLHNESQSTVFSVSSRPAAKLSQTSKQIRDQMELLDPGAGADTISPYPILSHLLLGNARYDWILAGVNIRASITRGDPRSETRKYSYLAAQLDFLLDEIGAGKFVIPADVNDVVARIGGSISRYGVSQTIQEITRDTGVLYYFEGKDPKEDTHFDRVGVVTHDTSDLLRIVATAVDPETATLDLRTLATNLPKLLAQEFVTTGDKLDPGLPNVSAQPQEITISEPDPTTSSLSEDQVQFLNRLGSIDSVRIDLTTFDGLSVLMRSLRIISDIGPNRGAPLLAPPAVGVVDPVPPDPSPGPDDPRPPGTDSRPGRGRPPIDDDFPKGKKWTGGREEP